MTKNRQKFLECKEKGDVYLAQNNLDAALESYNQSIQLHPQFWGAFYQKGDTLLRQNKSLEAASAFMSAWLFSRFRNEPGIMCARSLVFANFTLEACLVFEKISIDELDAFSVLMYAEALRIEARSREAAKLIPKFRHLENIGVNRTLGGIYLDLGEVELAKKELLLARNLDTNGYTYDVLIGVYYAESDFNSLRKILDEAISKKFNMDYYKAQKLALNILDSKIKSETIDLNKVVRPEIIESAIYIHPHIIKGCKLTGNTYQTLEIATKVCTLDGLVLEFGVRNGHTINKLAEMFPNQQIYGFDSFEGIPESWGDEPAGSYTVIGRVPKVPNNVEFVIGWFDKTLPKFKLSRQQPIKLMNIDCDIYSSTKTIFDELDRQIIPGTVIVFDEYLINKTWKDDEFKAFQEWVILNNVKYEYIAASMYTKQAAVKILSRS